MSCPLALDICRDAAKTYSLLNARIQAHRDHSQDTGLELAMHSCRGCFAKRAMDGSINFADQYNHFEYSMRDVQLGGDETWLVQ